MDRDMVSDSQAIDRVPDSQQAESHGWEHLFGDIRVDVFGVTVMLNCLMELVTNNVQSHLHWRRRRMSSQVLEEEEFANNHTHRIQGEWSTILHNTMSALRVLLLSLEDMPLRRINGPWYIKPRTIEWFYLYIDLSPTKDPIRFKQFFRISPNMFHQICSIVRVDLTSKAPACFHNLPNRHLMVEHMVTLAIQRLSIGDQLLGIGELFGLLVAIASRVTWRFIKSFNHRARGLLSWSQGSDMDSVKHGFLHSWGFPNCAGAIDVTHFLIELPVGENSAAYFDWKHNMPVTMQATVDNNCRFLDVVIGNPGSMQDSRVLRTSSFYHNVVYDGSKLNGPPFQTTTRYRLKEYLPGDVGYPLFNWLIVPFPRGMLEAKDQWN